MAQKAQSITSPTAHEAGSSGIAHWFEERRGLGRWLLGGAVAVIVIAIGAGIVGRSREQANAAASADLFRAQSQYMNGDYAGALTQLEALVTRHGSTPAAKRAQRFVGNCQLTLGRPVEAETAFRAALSAAGADELERSAALRGLAAALVGQGKGAEGGAEYEKAAALDGNPTPADDLFSAARAYQIGGRGADAARVYSLLLERHPEWPRIAEVRIRLEEARAL